MYQYSEAGEAAENCYFFLLKLHRSIMSDAFLKFTMYYPAQFYCGLNFVWGSASPYS